MDKCRSIITLAQTIVALLGNCFSHCSSVPVCVCGGGGGGSPVHLGGGGGGLQCTWVGEIVT